MDYLIDDIGNGIRYCLDGSVWSSVDESLVASLRGYVRDRVFVPVSDCTESARWSIVLFTRGKING